MRLSVIISTYNSPASLRRTLTSLEYQTFREFEVLIADDGSGPETSAVISEFQSTNSLCLRRIWHADAGFRKNTILNETVMAADGDYLVFLDGDCIARRDLVATHTARARSKQTLSCGSQIDLPKHVHWQLTREVIKLGSAFNVKWLREQGVHLSNYRFCDKSFRLGCRPTVGYGLDLLFRRAAGFVGCNSSAWKSDILRVNGFDESITYGVDDKDLGVRLINSGVVSRRLKYSLVYLHLDHDRGYADPALICRNKQLVRMRRQNGTTWTESGIRKGRRRSAA